jgi:hypothetical protein
MFGYNAPMGTNSEAEGVMETIDRWTEQLLEIEATFAEAHELLVELQRELKDAGRKKDMQALGEAAERLARYGRMFEDLRQSWAEVDG